MNKWKKVKLGDVAVISSGNSAPQGDEFFTNGIFPFCRTSDVGAVHLSTDLTEIKDKLNDTGIKGLTLFKKGTILIPKSGASTFLNHRAILGLDSYVSSHLATIQTNENFLFNLWAYYFFVTLDAKMLSPDTNYPTLKLSTISNIEIPLPAMEEQKKIAARLDAVSDLLAKQKQLLSEQDNLIQSTFYDMFGDPIKNNKGWKIEKFKELGTLERGKSQHRPRNAPELLGGPYPLIQTGDIAQAGLYLDSFSQTYSELGLKQSRLWKKGTLCITIAANIAKTSILNFDACFPDSVVGFINNTACSIMFIQIWMSFLQQILESNAPQAAQKNINLEILGNLDVIVPPLELQEKFAAIVEQIETEKSKIKSAIAETQTLFNALMSEYFEE